MATAAEEKKVSSHEEREKKLNESEIYWQNEIKLREVYIADLWQKIKDVSTDSNDRKLLRGKLHGYEDCIQKCQCALKDIKAQKKLLDFEREDLTLQVARPPGAEVSTSASPTRSEPTSDPDDLRRALQHGSTVAVQTSVSILVGVAGSGKTRSLAMALGLELPTGQVSTPCARAGKTKCTISHTRIGVKDHELCKIEDDVYLGMVVRTAKELSRFPPDHKSELMRGEQTSATDTPKCMRGLEEEVVRCFHKETRAYNRLQEMRWIRMTDCEGLLAILPLFSHISLGIIIIKLNERLDHHPMIEYADENGRLLGPPIRSFYSHEQIIRNWMRALVSQRRGTRQVKFLFLGTHRDLVDKSVGESIEQKDMKLLSIVHSFKMGDNIVCSDQGCKSLIFPINAKTPGPEDWEVMRHVRKAIVECSDVPSIRISIKWFAMELAILHYVKETGQAVLLESMCFKMLSQFHFDFLDFKAALRYLHQAMVIFYYEEGGLVIADLQVISDKVNELVCYGIELRTNPNKQAALSSEWKKFCQCGILNISCLCRFPRHYSEGVFSPEDLASILVHMCITVRLSLDKFIMPCLLPAAGEDLFKYAFEEQEIPSMVVQFPDGGPMLNTYCSLVCHLMCEQKWEVMTNERGEPSHLTRNSVHFSSPEGLPGKVVIDDPLSSFFLITYHGPQDIASKVCPLLRAAILMGVEGVLENQCRLSAEEDMNDFHAPKPIVTFLCCCETTPLHAAVRSASGKYLKCPYNCQVYEKVTEKHKIWLTDVMDVETECKANCSSATSAATIPLTLKALLLLKWKDTQGRLHTFRLQDRVSTRWEEFGTLLGLSHNQLEALRQDNPGNVGICWRRVMEFWLEGRAREEYPATWDGLHCLLQDAEYSEVARELKTALSMARANIGHPEQASPNITKKKSWCHFL